MKQAVRMIGVIGSGKEETALNAKAEEVGRLIAVAGFTLINGGMHGVMAASAKGAKSAGATVVGLLPGLDPKEGNRYSDVIIPTGLGDGRNVLIVRAACVLIAIGGGYGTLSEIALALKNSTPVVGLGTWEVSSEVLVSFTAKEAVERAVALVSI